MMKHTSNNPFQSNEPTEDRITEIANILAKGISRLLIKKQSEKEHVSLDFEAVPSVHGDSNL